MNDQEEINYFKDYFTGLDQNDININNNKSIFSNNINNASLSSSFNSYLSTNQGNNSFSPFNSMSSINTISFPLSFQYKNNLNNLN